MGRIPGELLSKKGSSSFLSAKGSSTSRKYCCILDHLSGWSLALIGNASAHKCPNSSSRAYRRGVFDKETRRKPLAFAADAIMEIECQFWCCRVLIASRVRELDAANGGASRHVLGTTNRCDDAF